MSSDAPKPSVESSERDQDAGDQRDSGTAVLTKDMVIKAIEPVQDPELFISIVDLGLIYDADINDVPGSDQKDVVVRMTLTSPGCPVGPQLLAQAHAAVAAMPQVASVRVDLVWSPPWNPVEMASDDAKEKLGIW